MQRVIRIRRAPSWFSPATCWSTTWCSPTAGRGWASQAARCSTSRSAPACGACASASRASPGSDYPAAALEALARARRRPRRRPQARGPAGSAPGCSTSRAAAAWSISSDGPRTPMSRPLPTRFPAPMPGAKAFHLAPMPLERQRALAAHIAGWGESLISLDPYEPVDEDNSMAWQRGAQRGRRLLSERGRAPACETSSTIRWRALRRLGADAVGRVQARRAGRAPLRAGADRLTEWSALEGDSRGPDRRGRRVRGRFPRRADPHGEAERALEQARVSASFAIEDWGPRGLLAATPEQAEERRQARFGART